MLWYMNNSEGEKLMTRVNVTNKDSALLHDNITH